MQSGEFLEAEPILDFFETMALLVRRGALDTEMVKHTFFYWIDRYYSATIEQIELRQATDPLIWRDLTTFVERLRHLNEKQLQHPPAPLTKDSIQAFFIEEQTEAVIP